LKNLIPKSLKAVNLA